MSSTVFNSASGDGAVFWLDVTSVDTWAQMRAGTGSGGSLQAFDARTSENWGQADLRSANFVCERIFLPFDTSALTSGANISAATLDFYPTAGAQANGSSLMAVDSAQASTSTVTTADYQLFTNTSRGSITIATVVGNLNAYNSITLDAAGRANINKTGYTKIGVINSLDQSNTSPAALSLDYTTVQMSEGAHTPTLTVTYTVPVAGGSGTGLGPRYSSKRSVLMLP